MPSKDHLISSSKATASLVAEARSSISRVQGTEIKNKGKGTGIQADRLLLALLEFAAGEKGKRYTACVVLAAAASGKNEELVEVARSWLDYLLFPFKAAAIDRIPLSAENTPLTDDDDGDSEADIDSTPTSFKKPVLEEDIALAKIVEQRDGCCAITGTARSSFSSSSSGAIIPSFRTTYILSPIHILQSSHNEPASASRSWEIIKNWGGLQSDPDAENLLAKTPQNAIALRMDLSLTFRHFLWWLKPADEPDTYILKSHLPQFPNTNKRFQFRTSTKSKIPPPDPRLITLHASLANTLHASGAAGYFDKTWREAEKSGCLESDGSSDLGVVLGALVL